MIILDVKQLSQEWFDAKLGIPSSSKSGLIALATGKLSKSAVGYSEVLAAELISGRRDEGFSSYYTEEGIAREDEARRLYSYLNKGIKIDTPGLCYKDESKEILCSPDGLMPSLRRGLEIKNPKGSTQVKYLKNPVLPADYHRQIQTSLYVTEYERWDWMSYYPGLRPLIIKIYPDPVFQAEFDKTLRIFLEMLASDVAVCKKEDVEQLAPKPQTSKPAPGPNDLEG